PTSSPNFVQLDNLGGCSNAYSKKPVEGSPGFGSTIESNSSWSWGVTYEAGDTVSVNNLVYQCKEWPFSSHCSQQGYEPMINLATPGAWKDAWTVIGYCEGTSTPTLSPSFDPVKSVGACPDEWKSGLNVAYRQGEMVSVVVSSTPLRTMVYKCKKWPFSKYCGQFSPTMMNGGSLGWELAGNCDGTYAPTGSPTLY
ncbi:hypothetical protein ACHAXR_000230, partial [Thalassiosira sp. AJA248-18]